MRPVVLACVVSAACGTERDVTELRSASVTVLRSGVPAAGVEVWFQASDSSLVLETTTSELGVAAAIIEDGAFVTVRSTQLVDTVPVETLKTFVGVRGGDALVIDELDESAPLLRIDITLPTEMPRYLVTTACSLDPVVAPTATIYIAADCVAKGLVVVATDEQDLPLGWIYEPAIGATVDLGTRAFVGPSPADIAFVNFPSHDAASLRTAIVVDDKQLATGWGSVSLREGAATWTARSPEIAGATYVIETLIEDLASPPELDAVIEWGAVPSSVDGALLLPQVPRIEVGPSQLRFAAPVPAHMIDIAIFPRPDAQKHWRVIAPTDGRVVALPTLPPAVADYAATSDVGIELAGKLIETSVGYDGLRANYLDERGHPFVHGPQGRTVVGYFHQ